MVHKVRRDLRVYRVKLALLVQPVHKALKESKALRAKPVIPVLKVLRANKAHKEMMAYQHLKFSKSIILNIWAQNKNGFMQ